MGLFHPWPYNDTIPSVGHLLVNLPIKHHKLLIPQRLARVIWLGDL